MSVTTADIIMVVVITMDNTAAGTIMGIGTMAGTIIGRHHGHWHHGSHHHGWHHRY